MNRKSGTCIGRHFMVNDGKQISADNGSLDRWGKLADVRTATWTL